MTADSFVCISFIVRLYRKYRDTSVSADSYRANSSLLYKVHTARNEDESYRYEQDIKETGD